MQCTSAYPCPPEQVNLRAMAALEERFGVPVGLSDHTAGIAIARGYGLVEFHATFDRRMFGPDTSSSLTIGEIAEVARFAADLRTLDANPVDKDAMHAALGRNKVLFGRSVGLRQDLPAGHVLRAGDLVAKKPGSGIPWDDAGAIAGRVLRQAVAANRLLRPEDME